MESLLDEVDSLVTQGLSTETPDWCSNCQSLKQEIKRLQDEQIQNFGKLKQKIISTDLLIKKYKSKCDDYDVQCKRNEEANKRADKYQRQCEILETQLKAALLDTEPLRKTKMTLEAEIRLKNAELRSMSDRMLAVESAQKQYEHLSRASSIDIDKLEAEKKDLLAKIKSMEAGKLTKEAAKEFRHEISSLKKEKAAMVKNEKRLESKLTGALTRIEHLATVVKERKFSPKRRRTASGNVSSPLKSPTRSPRGLSPRDNRPSPKGQGRSRTLSERKTESHTIDVIPPPSDGKLGSGSSSSSEDSDDCASLYSVSWTFSPLMKCLSPLPPSPACFAERKMKRQEDSVEVDDEGEVSDIADVLEQQLLEDDTQQQPSLTSDEIGDKNFENVKDSCKEASRKFNAEQKIEDSIKTLETLEDNSNHLETVNAKSEVENANQQEKNYEPLNDRITDASVAEGKRDGQQSLKEKLAESIIITSPTAMRKRIAHQPNQSSKASNKMVHLDHNKNTTNLKDNSEGVEQTSDRKIKKPPVRRSARINSQKDSELNEQESENIESKENSDKHLETVCTDNKRTSEDGSHLGGNESGKTKCDRLELYRNNTEEFSPSISETLSDSDVDARVNSISKNVLQVGEGDSNQGDMRLCKDITSNSISSQNITDSIGKSEGEDVNKVNIKSIRTSLNETKTDGTEEHIEIWKEKETSEVKAVPTPKSCLQSQEVLNIVNKGDKHPTLHKDIEALKNTKGNETSSNKNLRKFGPDKFINFQKSSSGPVTSEIEDFSYVDDYEVLDRSVKDSNIMSPREGGMHKKNVKRRLRRTCKYRDLDSETFTENKEAISGVRNKQTDRKKSSDKTVKEESVKESREKMEVGHSNVSNEKNSMKKAGIESEIAIDVSKDMKLNNNSDKTSSKYLSKRSNEQQEHDSKSICTTEIGIKDCIEPSVKISVNVSENEETMLKESKHNQIGDSGTESLFEDNCDHAGERMQLESDGSDIRSEKFTPNRQMSTGFMFSVPPYERVPSTDSSVSFGTSPSRLFNLETGSFDTIAEEETGEGFNKEVIDKESNSKISSDSNLIFGVEDLLEVRKEESPPANQLFVNAQNIAKPFCDINANTDNSSNTPEIDKAISKSPGDTASLSVETFDDEENKPGCSYHYVEPPVQLLPERVAEDTAAVKDCLQFERIPFVTEILQQDDSSSRSSMQSITSIDRASPLSPLSISPFDFLNPISPLPPSPIREIERVSPLSPEHVTEEQKSELVENEQDAIKDNEKDNSESDIKTNVKDNPKKLTDIRRQVSSFENNNISQVEESSAGNNKENDNVLQPEDYDGELKSNFNICDKVKDSKMKENHKKVQKVPGTPEKEVEFEESLKLFTLTQMISPVKTPKSQSRAKIKISKSMNELTQNNAEKTNTSSIVNIQFEKSFNKPKQFSTKAPESAIAVKPRPTRGRNSLDKSNIEMCIRKSSRTALKRVSSAERTDIIASKKVSLDAKCAAVEETTGYELESEKIDLKTVNDTAKDTRKVSGRTVANVEKLPVRNEDSKEVENKESAVEKVDEKGDNRVVEECPDNSQDNLAFKRKARVAHKPKVQPLKPHKIQIIDAPVLPPVTVGRKRKTPDNKREAQDKKPCKELAFKKQKSSTSISVSSISAVNPEARKKMQTYLKSSEAAESFVSKFSLQAGKDELHSELLNVCLECLGRVQTDTLEVVYKTCESGQYLNIQDQFPFMSDVDKKAVELFQYLWTELKADSTVVMRSIWDSIFSRDISTNIVGKMAQCRVFVALCSLQGDVEQARNLFFHLVTCGHLNCTLFIVSIISVWPEILKKEPSDRPDNVVSHGMTLVLEEVVTKMLLSQGSEASNKILLILQKLCNWSGTAGNADSIIKLLCNRLLAVLDEENTDKCELELTKALELLCSHQTWPLFKEHFIMRHGLQTASNKYIAVKILKPVPPEYVCAILRITSRGLYALAASVKEREYQQIIRNWLLPILSHKPGDAKVRQCCLETLLELSPLYPACLDSIHKWFMEDRDNVSVEFTARLEFLRHQYKQKFGLQCKPFVKP